MHSRAIILAVIAVVGFGLARACERATHKIRWQRSKKASVRRRRSSSTCASKRSGIKATSTERCWFRLGDLAKKSNDKDFVAQLREEGSERQSGLLPLRKRGPGGYWRPTSLRSLATTSGL